MSTQGEIRATAPRGGPLAGMRIIDLTQMLLGPYATQVLADLGAEVLKIEPPVGDARRTMGPARHPGMTSQHLHVNRGKRSIVVDLKTAKGREVVLRLCARADALIHNSRRQAMSRLGLDYQDIARVKPDIVYCSAVGFGEQGPYAEWPAYDDTIQGLSAVPSLNARLTGEANYAPFNLSDRVCGMVFAQTILAALLCRERTGQGQSVELPMFETMADFVLSEHLWGHTFVPPVGDMGATRIFERQPSRTKDGHICFWIGTDAQCARMLDALHLSALKSDERFRSRGQRNANLAAFYREVDAVFLTKTTSEWIEILHAHDVPAAPLNTLESLMGDPHLRSVGFLSTQMHPSEGEILSIRAPANWSATPPPAPGPAPQLGQDTRDVLSAAGFSTCEIDDLIAAKAIGAC